MITIQEKTYRELRCPECHNLLMYEFIFAGRVAIKCGRCGHFNTFDFRHLHTKENEDTITKDFSIGGEVRKDG